MPYTPYANYAFRVLKTLDRFFSCFCSIPLKLHNRKVRKESP